MASSPFPIFAINLKRSTERRANLQKQLDALGLECEYIEAVDGAQFTPHEVVEKYGKQVFNINPYDKQCMSLGAVGCLLSHLKIYDLMMRDNIPAACILEDDAELSPFFGEVLNSKVLAKMTWGIVLLGHYSMFHRSYDKGAAAVYWKRKVCPGHFIARAAEFPVTTAGYLVKLPAAEKLRDFAFPMRAPIDWLTSNIELLGETLRIITPPCIVPNARYIVESTIKGGSEDQIPEALKMRAPPPSLRWHLTNAMAKRLLGTRAQRSATIMRQRPGPAVDTSSAATPSTAKPPIKFSLIEVVRTIYYAKALRHLRLSIRKSGLFKYTRLV